MNPIKVLLIEDDKIDQISFKRLVESQKLPYDYTIVSSVQEARLVLGTNQYDIVITDFNLGDGTAFDNIELIKDTPIIITTGGGGEEIAVKAMKAGAYDYLIKDPEYNYLKVLPITIEKAIKHTRAEKFSRMLLHSIMHISDAVIVTDMNEKIQFVNNAFTDYYGYAEKEIIGETCTIFGVCDILGEFYHKRKDSSEFPVSISRSVIRDENGTDVAIAIVARDITERKKVEEEREKLINELKEALANVKTLNGLLPICASCKNIRDDKGYWQQVEGYIMEHSGASFSHGV
jgi:PAS domain-containing protein